MNTSQAGTRSCGVDPQQSDINIPSGLSPSKEAIPLRRFLESLTTMQHESNESSVRVKMSAHLVDHFEFIGSKTLLTLSSSTKSRKIQVQGTVGLLDHAQQQLSQLMEVYHDYCETARVELLPRGSE